MRRGIILYLRRDVATRDVQRVGIALVPFVCDILPFASCGSGDRV